MQIACQIDIIVAILGQFKFRAPCLAISNFLTTNMTCKQIFFIMNQIN